jgi:hypothetical protein
MVAFHADADLLDGVGGINYDLVVGLIAVFHPQVEIHQVDIEERVDLFVLDVLPDDPVISSPSSSTTGLVTLIFPTEGLFGKTARLRGIA